MRRLSNALVSVLTLTLSVASIEATEHCNDEYDRLSGDPAVNSTFTALLVAFNETCVGRTSAESNRCETTIDPVTLTLTQDYGQMASSTRNSLRSMCEGRRFGSNRKKRTLCDVTITTALTSTHQGATVTTKMVEMRKPVCFPDSCAATDAHARLLEPPPATCAQSRDCQVLGYEVSCPNDRPTTSSSSSNDNRCKNDALSSFSPFFLQRRAVEASMFLDCAAAMSPTESGDLDTAAAADSTCSVSVGDMAGSMVMNFTGFGEEADEQAEEEEAGLFAAYGSACADRGGRVCRVSMNGSMRVTAAGAGAGASEMPVPNAEVGEVVVVNHLYDYPQCVPPSDACADDADVAAVLERVFVELFEAKGVPCDVDTPTCNVTVTNVSCDDDVGGDGDVDMDVDVDSSSDVGPSTSLSEGITVPPTVTSVEDEEDDSTFAPSRSITSAPTVALTPGPTFVVTDSPTPLPTIASTTLAPTSYDMNLDMYHSTDVVEESRLIN